MGCAASSTATTIDNAQEFTYFEHSKLDAIELRRGICKDVVAPKDVVYRKALFQSSATVVQKLAGDGTSETIKIVDPELTMQHHVLELTKLNGPGKKKIGKAVLLTTATETWLMVFKGFKAGQSGTTFIHKLASKDDLPADPTVGHAKVIKHGADGWLLYDGPDAKAPDAKPIATAKDGLLSFCGFTARVCPGRADVGFLLALLVGAHLLLATQNYYRPAEKRALGSKGSLGSLVMTGVASGLNPITTFTDPLGTKMVNKIRDGAEGRLQHGHDAHAFHGITAWAVDEAEA